MFDARRAEILEAAVREFIRTGDPVSSQHLYDAYGFGVKPAMIRLELSDLTDEGYLEQAHHSAGRVPTNRGYEFFAERALSGADEHPHMNGRLTPLFERMEWRGLLDEFSRELGLLAVAATLEENVVYKDGLENLIDHLDWHSRLEIKSVIRDFEELESRMGDAVKSFDGEDIFKVFVGKKSPVTKSQCLSVVAGSYDMGGEQMFLFAIGPKRMDYEKTARVMKSLKKKSKTPKPKTIHS